MILNAHSFYSLRYGTLSPEKLVRLAAKHAYKQVALTDINNSTGAWDFVKNCQQEDISPVLGMECWEDGKQLYILLAKNHEGFHQINQFRTAHNLAQKPLPAYAPAMPHVFVIYPLSNFPNTLRNDEFVGVKVSQLNKLWHKRYNTYQDKLIALVPVSYSGSKTKILHRHLRAIDQNCLLDHLKEDQFASDDHLIESQENIRKKFSSHDYLWQRSADLLAQCSIEIDVKTSKNISCYAKSPDADKKLLLSLAQQGLLKRYGNAHKQAHDRVEKELQVIFQLGFAAYYLMTWDIVRYAKSQQIYHVGRGSGANSIVAYCLEITDVDPIELDLYFERFINPHRASAPDFDIDFSWKDRDRIYDYLFARYPKGHVALLGAVNTFQGKSVLRELSKCYGLPDTEIENLLKDPNAASQQNQLYAKIVSVGSLMPNLPNARSIHAGGVLVSQQPLSYYTALDLPPKGYPTAQLDMYIAESIGYEKLDVLSQRGLGHIQDVVEMLRQEGTPIDIHAVERFKRDPACQALLRSAQTIGCFYIESPAMRALLTKLRCDNYLSLVAASSIIRPGVAQSGMMQEYIKRFHKPENINYLHPIMQQQLSETYGVMVYQEDVLKICYHFAGLDLADADVLRRVMSGKPRFRNEAKNIVEKFFANCRQRGYPESLIREVWRQIESFAGYSFSKAHSASYAVESFQSLYLKHYYPLHFITAVLNNFGGFYQAEVYVNEAKKLGAKVHLPCINHSTQLSRLLGKHLFLGFVYLKNLEHKLVDKLLKERQANGLFLGIGDFVQRVQPSLEQLKLLIQAGALAFVGYSKAKLLWEAHLLLHKKPKNQAPTSGLLFPTKQATFQIPNFAENPLDHAWDEIELLGFPVSKTWFHLLKTKNRGTVFAHNLHQHVGKQVRILGQLITVKHVRTSQGKTMSFGTFLDFHGNFIDTVHFPPVHAAYPYQGIGVYLLLGKVTLEFGHAALEVVRMAKLELVKRFSH